jgi:hypothetical protein
LLTLLRFALLAAALLNAVAALAGSEPRELDALLAQLRARGAFAARFVEERELAVLAAPLRSRGEIAFTPPDHVRWEILEPAPSRLVIEGARVELHQPGSAVRRFDLRDASGPGALVAGLRLLLAGDRSALEAAYETELAADSIGWRIALVPRPRAARRVIAAIELAGEGDRPRELLLRFANGDRSHVRFEAQP